MDKIKTKTVKITPEQVKQSEVVRKHYGLATFSALVRYAINKLHQDLPVTK